MRWSSRSIPAKRLANALGLDGLTNEPHVIDPARWDPDGDRVAGGELSAMMLDTKSTFDGLVTRYAESEAQAQRILANNFYRNISGALSGTQEYMAMEKLHELYEDGGFDLIVVDTPPSRHALDFLDAPARLLRLLNNPIFRLLMVPARTGLKIAGAAVQAFIRTVSKVVGAEVVDDIVTFFRSFEGMEEGFRTRAARVVEILGQPETRFVLVTSPRRDAIEEARFFAERIGDHDLSVDALIVNRVHPRFGEEMAAGLRARAATLHELEVGHPAGTGGPRPPRGAVPEPRRVQRDRRAGAGQHRDRAGADPQRRGRVRAVPRPRRPRLHRARGGRRDPLRRVGPRRGGHRGRVACHP